MNEFKGTTGPWEVDGVEIYPAAGHRATDAICAMQPGFKDADAALIAAAPDLLYALTAALQELDMYAWVAHPKGADGAAYFNVTRSHARSAIAKALGEKP